MPNYYPPLKLFILLSLLMTACQAKIEYNEYFIKNCSFESKTQIPGIINLVQRQCIIGATIPRSVQEIIQKYSQGKIQYYLLNFWFLECDPCIREIPDLNELNQLSTQLRIISFSRNKLEEIKNNKKAQYISYTVVPNSDILCDSLMKIIWGYPTNILIDSNYKILYNFGGLSDNAPDKIELINFLNHENIGSD